MARAQDSSGYPNTENALDIGDFEQARQLLLAFLDYMRLTHRARFWSPDSWAAVRMSEDFVSGAARIGEFLDAVRTSATER